LSVASEMTEGGGGNENARLTGRVPVLIRGHVGRRRGGGGGKHGEEGAALDTSQMQAENGHKKFVKQAKAHKDPKKFEFKNPFSLGVFRIS
jgi:hypothetical protein